MSDTVINRLDFRAMNLDRRTLRSQVPRAATELHETVSVVTPLVSDVARRGRAAVLEYTERFDGVQPSQLRVPSATLAEAAAGLDPQVRQALTQTVERLREVSQAQLPASSVTSFAHDSSVTNRWLPVDRVGLYVPGGLAVYPSTVAMNAVPAQVAGVGSIAVVSPPQANGLPHPTVMAAAHILGIDEVWAMGGAQAVAALAHGFADGEDLEPVDLITGPGNAYVAAAKMIVRTLVGIDAVAGPTEIIIYADEQANPDYIAADLISQAEHDPQAAAVLVTTSTGLADAVDASLQRLIPATAHRERIETALAGKQSATIVVSDEAAAIAVLNAYAGEHVELHVVNPSAVAAQVTNGGAVFLGPYSPVALGDYCAGSNHVLPTSGTAAHASGLSVQSFLKGSQIINYTREGLNDVGAQIVALANAEDLPAHGQAISARLGG